MSIETAQESLPASSAAIGARRVPLGKLVLALLGIALAIWIGVRVRSALITRAGSSSARAVQIEDHHHAAVAR